MASELKLALVTRRYPPLIGGAEKVLSYLAEALAREGAEVTVLTSRATGTKRLPRREDVALPDARGSGRLTVVRLGTLRLRFVGTWLYMWNLGRWFATHPVDLAYVSMLKHDAYVAVGGGPATRFSGRAAAGRGGGHRRPGLAELGQLRTEDRPALQAG